MAKNITSIAAGLGAKVVGQVPDTGGGAFGAARLAKCVERRGTFFACTQLLDHYSRGRGIRLVTMLA